MIKDRNADGGGNRPTNTSLVIRRSAAIGDAICATSVADKLITKGYSITFQVHPDIHSVIRRHPKLTKVDAPDKGCHVNLDGAYENHPKRRHLHFHQMFFERARQQLNRNGIQLGDVTNCRPRLHVSKAEMEAAQANFGNHPRPWIIICPRSNSYACRTIPDRVWKEAADQMEGTKFWIGSHPAPEGIVDLKCRSLDALVPIIAASDLLVGAETGPMHIAAATNVPCVIVVQATNPMMTLNEQNDFITTGAALDCLHCQLNLCPKNSHLPPCQNVDPKSIARLVNARSRWQLRPNVSAVIPTYNAPAARLNRCIKAVLPQVEEVVVACDATGKIPAGVVQDSRVRYVVSSKPKLGFGKNVNQGVRNSNSQFILILNDDVFLDADAVSNLLDAAKSSDVGAVGHLLRYPSGMIQHGGKHRKPGMRGWGHTDHRAYHPTHKSVIEAEVVTGASMLVRRKAFYDVHGFDEDFWMYAEDDAFCLSLLSRGWRVRFTPFATGIHEECQSSSKEGNVLGMSMISNEIFWQKWGWWIQKNLWKVPGSFR